MKRSTWQGQTVVYRYGCPSWARLPDSAEAQLRMAHELRNELVAVEYRYQELVAGIWGLCPQVNEAKTALDAATARIETVVKATKTDRMVLHDTAATTARKEELKVARRARVDAKAAVRAAKDIAHVTVQPLLAECARARYEALAQTRATAVEDGLYWATGNDVLQCHDTAAQRIAEMWKSGRAAQRRFRRWDGSGTLSTQVMWGQGKPRRTPQVLASESSPWRNVFRIEPDECGRGRFVSAMLRIAKGTDPIRVPIVYHRPLPADGEVTDARLTRNRVAGQSRLAVCVTVRLPAPTTPVGGVPCSVVLGWAAAGEGAVRVARLASPFGRPPVPPPNQPELLDLLVPGDGWVDVVVPKGWVWLIERGERIRSHRDELLDELRGQICSVLAAGTEVVYPMRDDPDHVLTAAEVAQWRAPSRFARLARLWPLGDVVDHDLHDELLSSLSRYPIRVDLHGLSTVELWRIRDRHLWEYEAHERRQLIDRRRDAYRKVAAWICEQASEILLDAPPVGELRQVAPLGEEDTYQARAARRQVQLGAPGDLRATIVNAAARRGVKVIDTRREELVA